VEFYHESVCGEDNASAEVVVAEDDGENNASAEVVVAEDDGEKDEDPDKMAMTPAMTNLAIVHGLSFRAEADLETGTSTKSMHSRKSKPPLVSSISQQMIQTPFAKKPSLDRHQGMLKACVGVLAFFVGVFPIAWKIYETGYEFREASDPSRYDDMKEYFSESTLPFVEEIDSAKHSIRVYFFVVPFVVCCGIAVVKLLLQKQGRGKYSPWTRKLRPLLNHPLKLPHCLARLGLPYAVTVLDIVVVMTFLILNLALVWSRTHRSLGRGPKKLEFLKEKPGKDPIPFWSWGCVEILAKTLGVVSIVNLGWYLMVPIGRRSVFLELMHISWESAIKYHRWLGYYTCIVTIVHSLLYFVIWAEFNGHTTFDPNATMLRTNLV
jgi:hypothetical protein